MTHPLQPYLKSRRLDRLWEEYKKAVMKGEIPSLEALGLRGLRQRSWSGFTGVIRPNAKEATANQAVEMLLRLWLKIHGKDSEGMKYDFTKSTLQEKERQLFEMGMAFLHATKTARIEQMQEFIKAGVPVNFQHPRTGQSALHIAAGGGTIDLVHALVDTGEVNYLLQDKLLRTPRDCASYYSEYPEVERILLENTKKQAINQGVNLWEEHRKKMQIWIHEPWYHRALSRRYCDENYDINFL